MKTKFAIAGWIAAAVLLGYVLRGQATPSVAAPAPAPTFVARVYTAPGAYDRTVPMAQPNHDVAPMAPMDRGAVVPMATPYSAPDPWPAPMAPMRR